MIKSTKKSRIAMSLLMPLAIIVIHTTKESGTALTDFLPTIIVMIHASEKGRRTMSDFLAVCIIIIHTTKEPWAALTNFLPVCIVMIDPNKPGLLYPFLLIIPSSFINILFHTSILLFSVFKVAYQATFSYRVSGYYIIFLCRMFLAI